MELCERDLSARTLDSGAGDVTRLRESEQRVNKYEDKASHWYGDPLLSSF